MLFAWKKLTKVGGGGNMGIPGPPLATPLFCSYSVIVRVRVVHWHWHWDTNWTALFRTTLARTIILYELLILLGSNHLLCQVICCCKWHGTSLQDQRFHWAYFQDCILTCWVFVTMGASRIAMVKAQVRLSAWGDVFYRFFPKLHKTNQPSHSYSHSCANEIPRQQKRIQTCLCCNLS